MTFAREPRPAPAVFGYGSLVNRRTHDTPEAAPARVRGWRRVWRHSGRREAAYLSVEAAPGTKIDGLVAVVPGGDWAALDAREGAYERLALHGGEVAHGLAGPVDVHIYRAKGAFTAPAAAHPILLSYLDCVVQGFLRVFGEAGVARFFATTAGWHTPILDDRARPRYARHVVLTAHERALIDDGLARAARGPMISEP